MSLDGMSHFVLVFVISMSSKTSSKKCDVGGVTVYMLKSWIPIARLHHQTCEREDALVGVGAQGSTVTVSPYGIALAFNQTAG